MKLIKAGAAVANQIRLNWTGNREGLSAAIRQAKAQLVSVLWPPEPWLKGNTA
jgi:hypothetical protein